MNTVYKYILFDLDGTLTDSAKGITGSVQYALNLLGITARQEDLISFIGPPLQQSFREHFGFSEKQAIKAVELYRDYYRKKGIFENRLYPGVYTMLCRLTASGAVINLATSKPTLFAEKILKFFSIDHYFNVVMGSNLDGSRIEKKEVIEAVIRRLPSAGSSNTIMVGDRRHDLIGARKNGLKAVAVSYGYGTMAELEAEKPLAIAGNVSELTKFLLGYNPCPGYL